MVSDEQVREVASTLGIELTNADMASYAEVVRETASRFGQLDAPSPESQTPTSVAEGTDEFNAIRYRIEWATNTDGPLSDLDVVIKENMAIAGVPMHCGSRAMEFVPSHHASVVERLLDAGANVIGSTNMDEFAFFTTGETCAFGPTENPAVEGGVPGGSSSGSAAAVAAGLSDAGLGTDTGGSVRLPAANCGVVGLKPTHRSVSRFGYVDLSPTLDHIGPIARDIQTAARVYDAISGPDIRDYSTLVHSPPTPTRDAVDQPPDVRSVGIIDTTIDSAELVVAKCIDGTAKTLENHGIDTEHVDIPEFAVAALATLTISAYEFGALALADGTIRGIGPSYDASWRTAIHDALRSPDLGEHMQEQVIATVALAEHAPDHYASAKRIAVQLRESMQVALDRYDVLLTPTAPMTAPAFGDVVTMDDFLETVANTAPINLTGHPALTVPDRSDSSAPVGVQFVGNYGAEGTLFSLGTLIESAPAH